MKIRLPQSVLLAMAWLALAVPVAADCDMARSVDDALADGSLVFVGEATDVQGPRATFAVREVWSGEVGPTVTIHGFSDEGQPVEDDREWTEGATYLVVPFVDRDALRDNICTPSQIWDAQLAELRPADARIVAAEESDQSPLAFAGLVLLALAGISLLAFRRQSA